MSDSVAAPTDDLDRLRLEHAAEVDKGDELEEGGDLGESSEFAEGPPPEPGPEVVGITSHVLRCRVDGYKNYDYSSFLPAFTGAVYYRVAFYNADLYRYYLSNWYYQGSGNPYRTILKTFQYNNSGVRTSLVLWWLEGTTWKHWAHC